MRGSVIKKGKSWYVAVYLGIVNGRRKYKWYSGFKTQREADEALPDILKNVKKGLVVDTNNMKVNEFLRLWIDDHVTPNTSPSTADKYKAAVKSANNVFGDVKVQKLKPYDLQKWVNALTKKGLSRGTVNSYYAAVKSAFTKGIAWRIVSQTPCIGVTITRQKKQAMKTLTSEEVHKLMDATEGKPIQLVILLAISCGLRRGEILGLRWRNVDLDRRTLHVTENYTQSSEGIGFAELKTSGSHRTVNFSAVVAEALKKQRARQEEFIRGDKVVSIEAGRKETIDDLQVCTWEDNEPIRPGYVSSTFPDILKAAGLPAIRFHDLRHTHATLLLQAGIHPKVVQERLGHSKISMTLDTYSHVLPSLQKEAANVLGF